MVIVQASASLKTKKVKVSIPTLSVDTGELIHRSVAVFTIRIRRYHLPGCSPCVLRLKYSHSPFALCSFSHFTFNCSVLATYT
ncbi:hypothetical protein M378DRAFT_173804 [Amanita muscaria Koide BX008]|uniref:Uncharacterized protein n=1 Tax=Amanita muscaria (strain Koide BX008) TaxID=946122 RepID=A0A0C2WGJ4_AMAMK|nr:hypothetical protein M378DRAFT_173804 [Amanita muscaria Koide BX008]